MQAYNDFIVEQKEQVDNVEELEAKLKGLGDRFCNITLPAILQLAKQQGESVDLDETSILGMTDSEVYMYGVCMK
jgi:hypothetical protein